MEYYVLYDLNDNLVCYLDSLKEFLEKFGYSLKEINRKFRNSIENYIYLIIDNKTLKLYKFG